MKSWNNRWAVEAIVCGLLVVGQLGWASTVPFEDLFNGANRPLNGNGWMVTEGGTAEVFGESARLQKGKLSNVFAPEENAVSITFKVAPLYASAPNFPPESRFRFYVNTNGYVTAYDGGVATTLTHTPLNEGSNVSFRVEVDYPMQSWSLYVDGSRVAEGLALSGGDVNSRFEEIGFIEYSTTDYAYVDDVIIEASQSMGELPFRESFEKLDVGGLNRQRGWKATDAVVQTDVALGSKACGITSRNGYIEHTFIGGHSNVWTEVQVRPARGVPPSVPEGSTFAYYVNEEGYVVVYDGTVEIELEETVSADTWVTFATHSDYANAKWDLYLDESLIADGLDFYSTNVTHFTALGFTGGDEDTPAYIDNIYAGATRAPEVGFLLIVR